MNQGNENTASGYLIPNFRALTGGAFTHATAVRGGWTLEAGARYDYRWMRAWPYDRGARDFVAEVHQFQSLSGTAGLAWRFAEGWSLAGNVGTGWRPPGVNELYSNGVHHGTAQVEIGDPGLGPERSLDASLTLRRGSERVQAEVSAFANRIDGFLFLRPTERPTVTIRGVYPTFFYDQTDARLAGVDGSAVAWVAPWLRLGASLSLVRGVDLDAPTGALRPLVNMPSDRARLTARLGQDRLRLPGLTLGDPHLDLEVQLVREQTRVPDAFDYAPPPPGYQLVHLHLRFDVPGPSADHPAHISLSAENLFDARYRDYLSRFRYFVDDPGRTFVLRLTVPFGQRDPARG
jgi:iron complex outermembrane receptor protein